jgi:hypothetical protein
MTFSQRTARLEGGNVRALSLLLEDGQRRGIKGAKKRVDPMNLDQLEFRTKIIGGLDRKVNDNEPLDEKDELSVPGPLRTAGSNNEK